jgi:hypothetical protein
MKFVTPIVLAPVLLISIASLPFITGCGSPATSSVEATPVASIDKSLYTLEEEPEGALGVIEARESAADGAPVIIVGRIGGAVNPWVEGRAAFTLLDASISVVAEGEDAEEGEICVGDCCATERTGCTTLVKVVDQSGKLLAIDSRKLFEVKVEDMVVVKGIVKKDDSGNFSLLANGVYVRR